MPYVFTNITDNKENKHDNKDNDLTRLRVSFRQLIDRSIDIFWSSYDGIEVYQATLLANDNTIGSARYCYDGHVFILRFSETHEWIATYRASEIHNDVLITVTPYGICLQDFFSTDLDGMSEKELANEYDVYAKIDQSKELRWSNKPDLLAMWNIYEYVLWNTKQRDQIASMFNLMGELFLV